MKKAFILFVVLTVSTIAFSQQLNLTQFATLTHNDTVTGHWYGPNSFQSAYNAAMAGDLVTLSPGTFNAVTFLEKAIFIRGAGMMYDSVAQTQPTKISGRFNINVSSGVLRMEGLYCTADIVTYRQTTSPVFNKCRFNTIRKDSYTDVNMQNPIFTNCIIGAWDGAPQAINAMFINSIILSSWNGSRGYYSSHSSYTGNWYETSDTYTAGSSADVYYNCIVCINPTRTNNKRSMVNCITYSAGSASGTGANVYNTIGINDSANFYTTTTDHGNTNLNSFESIFKTFRGTYIEGEMFELTNSAATTYLGSDNTQVGIYGGSAVFNPKVTDMRIRKYSVGFYSDENGQLRITTELENE